MSTHSNDPHGFEPRKWELLHEVMAEADRQNVTKNTAMPDRGLYSRSFCVREAAKWMRAAELRPK
jgi:hypothetical protein